jgi:hypothetical protein
VKEVKRKKYIEKKQKKGSTTASVSTDARKQQHQPSLCVTLKDEKLTGKTNKEKRMGRGMRDEGKVLQIETNEERYGDQPKKEKQKNIKEQAKQ